MDKKVIVVDETQEGEIVFTQEELEEQARQRRLQELKKPKRSIPSAVSIFVKAIIVAGLFGIMLAMLLQSGVILAGSLIVVFCGMVLNYIIFR